MGRVRKCAVAYNMTRRVRAIPSAAVLDHMISVAELDYELTFSAPRASGITWDYSALGRAMNDEQEAQQFRDEVGEALADQLSAFLLELDAWMRTTCSRDGLGSGGHLYSVHCAEAAQCDTAQPTTMVRGYGEGTRGVTASSFASTRRTS
eukprot:1330235-Pyramimonas_sp.AAC.1